MLVIAALADASLFVTLPLLVAACFVGAFSVVLMGHGVALIPAALKGRGTTTLNGVLMGGTAILQIASGLLVEGAQAWFGTLSSGYRSEEHTSELQSLMRNSYAVFCLKKNK